MKIAFLTPSLEIHGGTLVMRQYVSTLLEHGHDVTIISPARGSWPDQHDHLSVHTYAKLPIPFLDTLTFQKSYRKHILHFLEQCKPDVIVPIYTPLLVPSATYKKRHPETKIVLIAQETFEMPIIGAYNRRLLSGPLSQAIDHLVTISKPLGETIEELCPKVPLSIIPNGIEHEHFFPTEKPRTQSMLFVGRPNIVKGYQIFIEAFNLARKQIPDLSATVVSPTESYETPDAVTFVSYKDRPQLANLYQTTGVYVSASLGESFGLPALEAMACGTPCVLSRTVGTQQYAIDGENCLLTDIKNAEQTAQAVIRILADHTLYEQLHKNGISTAADYRWEKSRARFLEVISAA